MNAPASDFNIRHDWTVDEIVAIHNLPLLDLIAQANAVHRRYHDERDQAARAPARGLPVGVGGHP